MTKEIELAQQHGIQYRLTPEGTTEMWCHDRNVQAFAEALVAAERERCARAVADYSLSFPFDENDRSLFAECAQFVRDGVLPRA